MVIRYYFLYLFICLFVWELLGVFNFANSLQKYKATDVDFKNVELLVVLTGGTGRLDTAYNLFKENNIKMLLVSGAGEKVTFDILANKYGWDASLKDNITVESESKTTIDNARYTASKIIEYDLKNICVVTSLTHMKRAYFIFNRVMDGLDVNINFYSSNSSELDAEDWWKDYKLSKTVFIEYIKYEYYKFLIFLER